MSAAFRPAPPPGAGDEADQGTAILPEAGPRSGQEQFLAALLEDMAARARRGERVRAEELFEHHPELRDNREMGVRVIYEEVCLREERGEHVQLAEILERFPHWREPIALVLDCHLLLREPDTEYWLQAVRDLKDFQVLMELGRGAQGRVFLTRQRSLADRPMVLKVTSGGAEEHLTLARLQHTNIVPLYAMHLDESRHLRVLCMPYFGGATLKQILDAMPKQAGAAEGGKPALSGKGIVDAIDQIQAGQPVELPRKGSARDLLARASYVQGVCWIGACLAEALHYAHELGLMHLDIKPSNVLLAADGQPMLLDFHLAQAPLAVGGPLPTRLGGTPGFMSPEQYEAFHALQRREPLPASIDGRSDIYSLGLLLRDALSRPKPVAPTTEEVGVEATIDTLTTFEFLSEVSPGLEAIVGKCLEVDPGRRYVSAGLLAEDLRRHLQNLPLRGVKNRSLSERWHKWRRRQPHALSVMTMKFMVLAAGLALALVVWNQSGQRQRQVEAALIEARELESRRDYGQAVRVLSQALAASGNVLDNADLAAQVQRQLRRARRGLLAQQLHILAERSRFLHGDDGPPSRVHALAERWDDIWKHRDLLLDGQGDELPAEVEAEARIDLVDLAVLWSDVKTRLTPQDQANEARRAGLRLLDDIESQLGASLALALQQEKVARVLGLHAKADEAANKVASLAPRTGWDHYIVGRAKLKEKHWDAAAQSFARAVLLEPQSFWANFYQGMCHHRLGRAREAAIAFRVATALRPGEAACYFNWALAEIALEETQLALAHLNSALRLRPQFPEARLQRGILHLQSGNHGAAVVDLQQALVDAADLALVHYQLARAYLGLGNRDLAVTHARQALQAEPSHAQARALLEQLAQGSKVEGQR